MAVNKVILNGEVLVDLTEDTATEEDVAKGKTFHLASGVQTTGTKSGSSGGGIEGGYTVNFMVNDSVFASYGVLMGDSVSAPVDNPIKTGYVLAGWSLTEGGDIVAFPYTPKANVTLYAVFKESTILGFTGLTGESGELTWTDDIAPLQSAAAYTTTTKDNHVKVAGALDDKFPFNQIEDIIDDEGNVFVSFPKFYMKWVTDSSGNIDGIKISNNQVDDTYFPHDAFLSPSGSFLDRVYLGKYEASGSSAKAYSKSGSGCLVSITRANMRAACRAYGSSSDSYKGYQQFDFALLSMYNFLCMLYYRVSNIQKVCSGRTDSSNTSASSTGTTDIIDSMNGWNTVSTCVKMLGVENPYGNVHKWVDGVYFSSATIYAHRNPTQYADSTSGATPLGFSRPTMGSYIEYLKSGALTQTRSYVYCAAVGGSAATYVGDASYYSSRGTVLFVGGNWNLAAYAGLWFLGGDNTASNTNTDIGGRLCKRPL